MLVDLWYNLYLSVKEIKQDADFFSRYPLLSPHDKIVTARIQVDKENSKNIKAIFLPQQEPFMPNRYHFPPSFVFLTNVVNKLPWKIFFFALCGFALIKPREFLHNESVIQLSPDDEHEAYRGPSIILVQDKEFNQTRDLVAWTTDRHTSKFWYHNTSLDAKEEYSLQELRTSFDLEGFPEELKEGLIKVRKSRDFSCFRHLAMSLLK